MSTRLLRTKFGSGNSTGTSDASGALLFNYYGELEPDGRGDQIALRHKRLGIWHEITWRELAIDVGNLSVRLGQHGAGRGTRIAFMGQITPRLVAAILAAQSLGAVIVSLGASSLSGHALYEIFSAGNIRIAVADRPESALAVADAGIELDYLLADQGSALDKGLARIVEIPSGIPAETQASVAGLSEPRQAIGLAAQPDDIAFEWHAAQPRSKLSITHRELAGTGFQTANRYGFGTRDSVLIDPRVFLPYGYALWLASGLQLGFAESLDTTTIDRREIGSTRLIGSPASFREIREWAFERAPSQGRWSRRVLDWGLKVGGNAAKSEPKSTAVPGEYRLAREWVLKPLREVLGLSRIRSALVLDGHLATEDAGFLSALGIAVEAPNFGIERSRIESADVAPQGTNEAVEPPSEEPATRIARRA